MKVLSLLAGLAALPALFGPVSALAEDPGATYVWKVFGGDGDAASLLVVDKAKADDPEAHYKFYLSCTVVEPWTMNVSDLDNKTLGKTIADGGQPTFRLVIDGKPVGEEGGYSPDLIYNQEDKVWEYSTNWDLSLLDVMQPANAIAISGTGIDLKLPAEGMKAAITEFKTDCEALQATTDEGEPDDALPEEPDDGTKTP